jgi:hypothetical protein
VPSAMKLVRSTHLAGEPICQRVIHRCFGDRIPFLLKSWNAYSDELSQSRQTGKEVLLVSILNNLKSGLLLATGSAGKVLKPERWSPHLDNGNASGLPE